MTYKQSLKSVYLDKKTMPKKDMKVKIYTSQGKNTLTNFNRMQNNIQHQSMNEQKSITDFNHVLGGILEQAAERKVDSST